MALHSLTDEEDTFDIALDAIIFGAVKKEVKKALEEERLDDTAAKVVHTAVKGVARVEKADDAKTTDADDRTQSTSEGKQPLEQIAVGSAQAGKLSG
jgi:hypothetical protein